MESVKVEANPAITTSVCVTPHLWRQIFCGANYLLTVNHNIIVLGYNDTKYSVPFMTL